MGLIIAMLIALLNTLLNHTMLTRKKSLIFCHVLFLINSVIVIIAVFVTRQLINDMAIYKYIFCIIMFMYIVYIHIIFEETISKKIFVMISTWVISVIIYSVSILIAKLYIDVESVTNFIYGFRILAQIILLWILAKPWYRENYKRILLLVQDNTINLMSIYMSIAFLLLLNNISIIDVSFRNFATVYDLLLFIVFIILGYVIVFTGISSTSKMVLLQQTVDIAEKKSEEHLKMANIDCLTGVASRLNILNKITDAILESDNSQKLAVLMLDIDKFKFVNDNYGHKAGDEVLKFLTEKINGCLRETDTIGRVGGDEFVILIKDIHAEADIETMICKIFEVLKTPLVFNQQNIQINVSVGISIFPDFSQNLDSLINQADRAMYEAKKTVGSRYCLYSDSLSICS
ncbi:GGDEF domain-containing protein [[Clostridium] fimetarium]|uniref:Diguanylate cyclase (GGDEF) domain-containing protein n=1 Tax=[Clostridium] fimetarium TaxID=99656 RepID=A0A1I0PGA1_9FIRM|nr:GGDEF domain-containing protein [[Clostridium] fimetarium]SEW13272.1 diguanylate cyclase (GGDEF) domain-containing protein [[Clostridium] fimetarium]